MLAGGILAGFGAASSIGPTICQPAAAQAAQARRIDVHHHCYPATWFAKKRSAILASSDNSSSIMMDWTPQRAVEQLDRHGIATALLSIGNPGVWFGDKLEGRALARSCNEDMAAMARDHRGRFGVFAALPLPDVEGSLAEIAYAFDVLKVDGVHLLTSYGTVWPGDPAFAPVFDELNRRKAVVFIHPTAPDCCAALQPGIAQSVGEYPFDEVRCIMSLLYGGTFTRCPDTRFIFTHAGGPMPVLAARMEQQLRHPEIAKRLPEGAAPVLKKLYFDIANSTVNRSAMLALTSFVPQSQILFGSDYPYIPIEKTIAGFDGLGYAPELLTAINRGNAAALFPQFA